MVSPAFALAGLVCLSLCAATIAAYAGLIPLGHWQDEFYTLNYLREGGLHAVVRRVVDWSPRPFSEILVVFYGLLVDRLHRPLIGVTLAACWGGLAVSVLGTPLLLSWRLGLIRRVSCLLLAAALFVLFLLEHPTGEMFYWPVGALAYLPGLAALCIVFWMLLLTGLQSRRSKVACAAALLVATCSIEVCAILVPVFAGLGVLAALCSPSGRRHFRSSLGWLVAPALVALSVLVLLYRGRVTQTGSSDVFGDPAIARHVWLSLRWSTQSFLKELAVADWSERPVSTIALGVVGRLLLCVAGFGLSRSMVPGDAREGTARWLAVFAGACIATSFLTMAAGMFQFGAVCCERHETFRQCLICLGLLSGAAAAGAAGANERRQEPPLGYVCALIAAIVIPLVPSVPAVRDDYAHFSVLLDLKAANWRAGVTPGDSMLWRRGAQGRVVGGLWLAENSYAVDAPGTNWCIKGIMQFFGKKTLTVRADK